MPINNIHSYLPQFLLKQLTPKNSNKSHNFIQTIDPPKFQTNTLYNYIYSKMCFITYKKDARYIKQRENIFIYRIMK